MQLLPVAVVENWFRHSGTAAEPLRWFCSDSGEVVVEERGWRVMPDALVVGEQIVASAFSVRDGQVVHREVFAALDEALAASRLTTDDEVLQRS